MQIEELGIKHNQQLADAQVLSELVHCRDKRGEGKDNEHFLTKLLSRMKSMAPSKSHSNNKESPVSIVFLEKDSSSTIGHQ